MASVCMLATAVCSGVSHPYLPRGTSYMYKPNLTSSTVSFVAT
jgi:hypothetical protein